jgi:hypothetical protein
MRNNQVYVLSIESVIRGESNLIIAVFSKSKDAIAKLEEEYNRDLKEWKEWCEPECMVNNLYESKTGAELYEKYNASNNHIYYQINLLQVQ